MLDYSVYFTKEKIKKFYKIFSLINIGIGIIIILFPVDNLPIEEKISMGIVLNVGYHMFFHLISIVPIKQLNWVKENKNVRNLSFKSIKSMTYFVPITCILISLSLMFESIMTQQISRLSVLFVFVGIILGMIKLNGKLFEWKKTHYNNV